MISLSPKRKYEVKNLSENSSKKVRLCRLSLPSNVKLKLPNDYFVIPYNISCDLLYLLWFPCSRNCFHKIKFLVMLYYGHCRFLVCVKSNEKIEEGE